MALFDNISEKLSIAAEKTASKAKEIMGITKLNARISAEEREIEKAFMEIGKMIFEQSQGNKSVDVIAIEGLCDKVKASEVLIEEFKASIQEIKEQRNKEI